jgi:hypothetical protein
MSTLAEAIKSINNELKTKNTGLTDFGTAINTMVTSAGTDFGNLGTFAATAGAAISVAAAAAAVSLAALGITISTSLSAAATEVSTKFGEMTAAIEGSVGGWAGTVQSAIDAVKALFEGDFDWGVPELKIPVKTPKFEVEGSWGFDDSGNVSTVPTIKVSWYKRAAEMGALFDSPTIIGVGDANQPEMLIGEDTLYNSIRRAVAENAGLNQTINITAPQGLDAAETARLIRNNSRQMLARMKGGV